MGKWKLIKIEEKIKRLRFNWAKIGQKRESNIFVMI